MGDIADMMLDGTLCEGCGVYMDSNGHGTPRRCSTCRPSKAEQKAANIARMEVETAFQKKEKCPTCGRRVRSVGMADHQRDAHGAAPAAAPGKKPTNTMRVNKGTSVQALAEFIRSFEPQSAVGHLGVECTTWLLKATPKGGKTLARVVVQHDADHVYEAAWKAATAQLQAQWAKELAQFDALCEQGATP